jgi:hypothetical protein
VFEIWGTVGIMGTAGGVIGVFSRFLYYLIWTGGLAFLFWGPDVVFPDKESAWDEVRLTLSCFGSYHLSFATSRFLRT